MRSAWQLMSGIAPRHVDAVLSDGIVAKEERALLDNFRERHHISQAEHDKTVTSFGWTLEEFQRGRQGRH